MEILFEKSLVFIRKLMFRFQFGSSAMNFDGFFVVIFGYFLWVKIKYGWIRSIFDGLGSLYINQVDIHVEKKIPRVKLRPDVNR